MPEVKSSRQHIIELARWLYPNLTSLAQGEPDADFARRAKAFESPPPSGKVPGTDDPRMSMATMEALDVALNLMPSGGAKAAMAGAGLAAKLARKGPQFTKAQLKAAEEAATRAAGGHAPLEGLPREALDVGGAPFVPGPWAPGRDIAEEYMRAAGLPYVPPKTYAKVDVPRAEKIAKAFDEMPHAPNDPKVRASYDAMVDETVAQFKALENAGIKFEFIKPGMKDPYAATPRLAQKDVIENKHLWVFPTEGGFGSGTEASAKAMQDNPLLRPTDITVDGRKLVANDVFRIVHDFFGHIKEGHGFRAAGEENAWRSHAAMYSDLARPAMTTETRGQNSWLNYGPHGEKNRTAKSEDTVFADQKIGLLPDWVTREGRFDTPPAGSTLVNIGFDVPGGGKITEKQAVAALKKAGVDVVEKAVHQSDTESTLVARISRPLTEQEAHEVSVALKQDSIAQHVPGGGSDLYGPKAADWRPFNPDYFLTPDGGRLSETFKQPVVTKAVAEERRPGLGPVGDSLDDFDLGPPTRRSFDVAAPAVQTSSEQTVIDPVRNFKPGIYKNPAEIAAEAAARVAPENPAMKQLFGVTRDDLYEMSKSRTAGNAPSLLRLPENPRGSAAAQKVTGPLNTQRILDVLHEAERYPQLTRPMDAWYTMDPYFKRLKELVGHDEAVRLYKSQNTFTGMASPGSEVPTEIRRGSAANWLNEQGRFKDFEKYGGTWNAADIGRPEDMRNIPGHAYHSTAHVNAMRPYAETGEIKMTKAKVPVYIDAGGVPETGYRWDTPVGDAHWSRAIGLPDTRTVSDFNRKGQPSGLVGQSVTKSELGTLAPWWREQVAEPLGLLSVPAQARAWGVFAPQTGVETAIGAPKLELWSEQIMRRAKELGMQPETVRDLILMGKQHASAGAGETFA